MAMCKLDATCRLAVTDVGDGPAVVLLHGHPFSRQIWRSQVVALAEQRYRVIAPDLRGYGDSRASAGTVTMGDLAADVIALLDALHVGRVAAIGLSMGGLVVMELLRAQPERVWAAGFVATTAAPVTFAERVQRLAMAAWVEERGMRLQATLMLSRLFGDGGRPAVSDWVERIMLATDPLGAAAALRGRAERPDYRSFLRTVTAPTFVCVGALDGWSTEAVTAELTGCLSDPTVVELERVGHLPNVEAPDVFNAHLLAFLEAAERHSTPRRASSMRLPSGSRT
jgi:pimeloyl-ACP methyl ester carboxylesterase